MSSERIKSPEAIAALAKEFKDSEFGDEFIATLDDMIDLYTATAHRLTSSAELKLACNERAAAVQAIKDFVINNAYLADHPELIDGATDDGKTSADSTIDN